jgi:hypothetical protein
MQHTTATYNNNNMDESVKQTAANLVTRRFNEDKSLQNYKATSEDAIKDATKAAEKFRKAMNKITSTAGQDLRRSLGDKPSDVERKKLTKYQATLAKELEKVIKNEVGRTVSLSNMKYRITQS